MKFTANTVEVHRALTLLHVVITFFFAGADPACTQPDLTSVVEIGDMLPFNCSFEYRGRWAPTIEWFDVDNVTVIASNNAGTFNRSVIHAITVPVTLGMHGGRIRARVFFEAPLNPPPNTTSAFTEATNLPDYYFEFQSDLIVVACK